MVFGISVDNSEDSRQFLILLFCIQKDIGSNLGKESCSCK
jgi:hypothetical protein